MKIDPFQEMDTIALALI